MVDVEDNNSLEVEMESTPSVYHARMANPNVGVYTDDDDDFCV
jgi:hypothetical protein